MRRLVWDDEKNELLKATRQVSFEQAEEQIRSGATVIIENTSRNHPKQRIYLVRLNDYIHAVPFTESEEEIFLETIFPNRKLHEQYKEKL